MIWKATNYSWIKIFGLGILALWLYQCAQIVAPSGGAKDTAPPVLDTLGSFENFQTNFVKQDFELKFDEWIRLEKIREQVVTSPELGNYEMKVKGKSVLFSFDEEPLKEDITYIINFGESIVDITEGNPVSNFRIVFSTGDKIDSLSLSGNVKDAVTGENVENAVVILHDNLADTAVTTVKPLYVVRTDEVGNFKLENIKSDTFQIFALLEKTDNYIYESGQLESIAFIDSFLVLQGDVAPVLNLTLSKPIPDLLVRSSDIEKFGRVAIGFNQKPEGITVAADTAVKALYSLATEDSLLVWYNKPDTLDWNIILTKDTSFRDTVRVLASKIKEEGNLDLTPIKKPAKAAIPTNPFDTFQLAMNFPIQRVVATNIILKKDSVEQKDIATPIIDKKDKRNILFKDDFKEGSNYELQFLPGALISLHQRTNDTLTFNLQMQTIEDLSNFTLNILGLDSTAQYLFTLKNKEGLEIDKRVIKELSTINLKYPNLNPSEYIGNLVFDENKNGKWDPGDFKNFRQPEKVVPKEFGKFLPNFDRDEEWDLKTGNN